MHGRVASVLVAGMLAACGGQAPAPPQATLEPAVVQTGDVTIRATVLPTTQLNDAMAGRYDVRRDAGTVLLVVGLRRGDVANELSVNGDVRAEASDLLGNRQAIALREIHDEGFIDYVGEARVSAPDTLRFTVQARPEGAPPTTLRFNRDFFRR